MGCCTWQGMGLGTFPCCSFYFFPIWSLKLICIYCISLKLKMLQFFFFLIFFSSVKDFITFYPEWGRYLKVLNVSKDCIAQVCPYSVQFCFLFWIITFIGRKQELFFSLILLKLGINASEENYQCFISEQFQDDGYYCKKYFFISIFCFGDGLIRCCSEFSESFNLSACFSSINFLVKFSVMNVSRKV